MKNKFKIIIGTFLVLLLTGCSNNITINKDSMDNINIYTSLYPIEYTTNKLYNKNAKINGMYPAGIDPYEYKLTEKQINDYSKSDLIIYNGLTDEKDLIAKMLNKNKELKIIDATARISYDYNLDEIWINPSNILVIAKNIKDGLNEYINSNYLMEDIEKNYDKLNLEISKLNATIKEDVDNASNKIIVTSSNTLKIFEKYGLTVYSLDEENKSDNAYTEAINLIGQNKIKYIYITSSTSNNKYVKLIKEKYPSIKLIQINTLKNISDNEKNNKEDYISIMNENLENIKKELYQ